MQSIARREGGSHTKPPLRVSGHITHSEGMSTTLGALIVHHAWVRPGPYLRPHHADAFKEASDVQGSPVMADPPPLEVAAAVGRSISTMYVWPVQRRVSAEASRPPKTRYLLHVL
jgi:hypothetical protein